MFTHFALHFVKIVSNHILCIHAGHFVLIFGPGSIVLPILDLSLCILLSLSIPYFVDCAVVVNVATFCNCAM